MYTLSIWANLVHNVFRPRSWCLAQTQPLIPSVVFCRVLSAESVFPVDSPARRFGFRSTFGIEHWSLVPRSFICGLPFWQSDCLVCRGGLPTCAPPPRNSAGGRIAGCRRKSNVDASLHPIAWRVSCAPPHAGHGAHRATDASRRLPVLLCKRQYTRDSNYRADSRNNPRRHEARGIHARSRL